MTALAPVVPCKTHDQKTQSHDLRQQRHWLSQSSIFETICEQMPRPMLIVNQDEVVVWANRLALAQVPEGCEDWWLGSPLSDVFPDFEDSDPGLGDHFQCHGEEFRLLGFQSPPPGGNRLSLKRSFFHDLLNTVGGMQGLTGILREASPEEWPELTNSVRIMADQLVDEILSHRDLMAAETGELKVQWRPLASRQVGDAVINTYRAHRNTGHRHIRWSDSAEDFSFYGDSILIGRILGNMVKNALEATLEPEVVTLDCGRKPGVVWFSVHNPGFIPTEHHSGIFSGSFSTKGKGRGTGTASMKLFAEKYLGGQVGFKTDPTAGTTFTVNLPCDDP